MPVSFVMLEESSDTTNDVATTGSIDPAGWPVLLCVTASSATTASTTVTATPAGGTFTQIANFSISQTTARAGFLLLGTDLTVGTVSLDADQTTTGWCWSFIRLVGAAPYSVQTATAGGKGAPAGSDWDLADTVTASLAAVPRDTSKVFAMAFLGVTTDTLVQGANYTEIGTPHSVSTPSTGMHTSWTAGAVQQTAPYTQTSGNNAIGAVLCVEIPALRTQTLVGVG